MSLLQQIKDASLAARLNKSDDATFLVTLYAEAAKVGKDKRNGDSTDEEVLSVLQKFKAGAEIIIQSARTLNGPNKLDQIRQAETEIQLVEQYLPKQLTEDELRAIINGYVVALVEVTPKAMGSIMASLKQDYAGKYDGTLASTIVKAALNP